MFKSRMEPFIFGQEEAFETGAKEEAEASFLLTGQDREAESSG